MTFLSSTCCISFADLHEAPYKRIHFPSLSLCMTNSHLHLILILLFVVTGNIRNVYPHSLPTLTLFWQNISLRQHTSLPTLRCSGTHLFYIDLLATICKPEYFAALSHISGRILRSSYTLNVLCSSIV